MRYANTKNLTKMKELHIRFLVLDGGSIAPLAFVCRHIVAFTQCRCTESVAQYCTFRLRLDMEIWMDPIR